MYITELARRAFNVRPFCARTSLRFILTYIYVRGITFANQPQTLEYKASMTFAASKFR